MTPVKSSNIKAVGYDPQSQCLTVEFKNSGRYRYDNVPPECHAALMAADSIGSHFHTNVRSLYDGVRIDEQ